MRQWSSQSPSTAQGLNLLNASSGVLTIGSPFKPNCFCTKLLQRLALLSPLSCHATAGVPGRASAQYRCDGLHAAKRQSPKAHVGIHSRMPNDSRQKPVGGWEGVSTPYVLLFERRLRYCRWNTSPAALASPRPHRAMPEIPAATRSRRGQMRPESGAVRRLVSCASG
jgi:hypothetical protein